MTAAQKRASFAMVWQTSHKWNFAAGKFDHGAARRVLSVPHK